MFRRSTTPTGFAVVAHDERAAHGSTLPVLIATASLLLSTAAVLTVMTVSAARAASLF
jgi:hypothetical protein